MMLISWEAVGDAYSSYGTGLRHKHGVIWHVEDDLVFFDVISCPQTSSCIFITL